MRFIEAVKLFSFLANVADSNSLIVHPAPVTYGQLTEAEQRFAGVEPEQIYLSVGTEDVDDLIWDLDRPFPPCRLDVLGRWRFRRGDDRDVAKRSLRRRLSNL